MIKSVVMWDHGHLGMDEGFKRPDGLLFGALERVYTAQGGTVTFNDGQKFFLVMISVVLAMTECSTTFDKYFHKIRDQQFSGGT